jgi:glycosyltransferase involved in cell wall biosynthesis
MPEPKEHDLSIGVVIPVFNGAAFIAEAIESVLRQDSPPDEFIVFDNLSTDATPDILREYQINHGVIVVTAKQHLPRMVDSWNFAVEQLSTSWFHLLSADDLLSKSFIRKFRMHLHEDVAAISMLSEEINQNGKVTLAKFSIGNSRVVEGKTLVLQNLFSSSINVASVVVSKPAWKQINGYPTEYSYWHDMVFWQRLASVGSVKKVNLVVARYRTYLGGQKSALRIAGIAEDRNRYINSELPNLEAAWSIELDSASSDGNSRQTSARQKSRRFAVALQSKLKIFMYKLGWSKW